MSRKVLLIGCCCLQILADGNSGFAQNEIIFPIFANTDSATVCTPGLYPWQSRFSVFNPSSSENTVVFTAYDSSGGIQNSISLKLKPFTINGDYTATHGVGWVKITGSQPLVAKEAVGRGGCSLGSPLAGELFLSKVDLSPASASRRHIVNLEYVPTALRNTGLSIVFPGVAGSAPAKGKLIHRWIDGELVAEKEFVIPPNSQLIGLISELLPAASVRFLPTAAIIGSLEITFDHDVFVTALRLNLDEVGESFSGEIPALP
jgi:hypothetical protein